MKNYYWIADPEGVKALVEGADERDRWTKVHGWTETEEPERSDRVWLYNPDVDGRTVLTKEAADGYWKGVGWVPGAPPEPVDLTKDPALRDQPKPAPAARVAAAETTTSKPAAADSSSKEK